MFEKHREANSLAAISRAVAEQRKKHADEEAAKPVKPPQPDPAAGVPAAAPPRKEKKEKKRKRTREVTSSDEEKEQAAQAPPTKSKSKVPTIATAPPPPCAPALPSVDDAFRDWYMARLAEDFEADIEGLNEADAPVSTRALLQALEGSLALFSPAERRVALAAAGIQVKTDLTTV